MHIGRISQMVDLPDTDSCAIRYRFHQPEEIRYPDSVEGQSFIIEEVQNSEISLLDYTETLTIVGCEDATIRCGPTKGVCKVTRCRGCMITVACSHLVMSECQDLIIFLYTASEPVLNSSNQVTFAPYNLAYPYLRSHFDKAQLDPRKNLWSRVRTELEYGVAWNLLPTQQFFVDRKDLQDYPSPDDPVARPELYGGMVKGEIVVGSQLKKLKRTETTEEPAIIVEQVGQPQPPQSFETVYTHTANFEPAPIPHLPISFASDSKTITLVFIYDEDQGFNHSNENPTVSQIPGLDEVLGDLTEQVKPHYLYLNTLKISAFALVLSTLLLDLFIILLGDFVGVHDGGLAINLLFTTVLFICLFALIILQWRSKTRQCTSELATFLAVKQAFYQRSGLDLSVSMSQVTAKFLTS